MATLYLAERGGAAGFSKHVAIKVVHSHLADDPYFVEMFLDEARLSARIQHPNCVHVEQLGEIEGTYYLVMEFVHGTNLSSFLRALHKQGRRLSPELAVHIALAVADGLHGAHETRSPSGELLGVVHRDVSPDNILLSYQGHVKLIDFGVAKARGRAAQTEAQTIKGKFRYMSPEHALGHAVDRRTDIYSLGILLWEMLTARRLFDAPNQWILLNMVREPKVDPPSTYSAEVSGELDAIVLQALARDADDRPATALTLRRRLAEAVPSAFGVTAPELAEILRHVLAERLAAEEKLLPQDVSQAGVGTSEKTVTLDESDLLETFTLRSADVGSSVTPSDEDDLPARPSRRHTPIARLSAAAQRLREPRRGVVLGMLTGALLAGMYFGLSGGGAQVADKETKVSAPAAVAAPAPRDEQEAVEEARPGEGAPAGETQRVSVADGTRSESRAQASMETSAAERAVAARAEQRPEDTTAERVPGADEEAEVDRAGSARARRAARTRSRSPSGSSVSRRSPEATETMRSAVFADDVF
jgi:serine/threonine-protein kinase